MDTDDDIEIGRRTWERATLPIQQDAFREGYDVGHKDNFQQGFDSGYRQGFKNGFKMGLINATLKAVKDLNTTELDGLGLSSYEFQHRGRCIMCPPEKDPFTKEKMTEIASRYESVEQISLEQSTVTFPEKEIESILNKFNRVP